MKIDYQEPSKDLLMRIDIHEKYGSANIDVWTNDLLKPQAGMKILDVGCGAYKAFPHFIGVDNGHHWGKTGVDVMCDAKLDLFASQSCDTVYSSHLLEHIPYDDVPATLYEWARVTKIGGQPE